MYVYSRIQRIQQLAANISCVQCCSFYPKTLRRPATLLIEYILSILASDCKIWWVCWTCSNTLSLWHQCWQVLWQSKSTSTVKGL